MIDRHDDDPHLLPASAASSGAAERGFGFRASIQSSAVGSAEQFPAATGLVVLFLRAAAARMLLFVVVRRVRPRVLAAKKKKGAAVRTRYSRPLLAFRVAGRCRR